MEQVAVLEVFVRRFDPLLVFVLMGLVWMVAVPTAAEAATRGEHRYFTGNVQVSDCTFPLPTATNSLPPNPLLQVYGDEKWKFTVDRLHVVTDHSNRTATTNRTYAEIRFWNWTNGENVPLPWRPHLGGAVRRTFCVEKSALDAVSTKIPVQNRYGYGLSAITVPLKLRLADWNRPVPQTDVEVGAAFGFTARLSQTRPMSASAGIALGLAGEKFKTTATSTEPTEVERLVASPAVFISINRGPARVLLLYGTERVFAPRAEREDWDYNLKPWVGIGIGLGKDWLKFAESTN